MNTSEVEHAYDVAAGLEGMLVYRLAAQGTEEQFEEISDAVVQMEQAATSGNNHAWVVGDMRFHRLLAEYGNNPLLSLMLERVDTIIGRLRFLSLHVIPQGAQMSAHEHRIGDPATVACRHLCAPREGVQREEAQSTDDGVDTLQHEAEQRVVPVLGK